MHGAVREQPASRVVPFIAASNQSIRIGALSTSQIRMTARAVAKRSGQQPVSDAAVPEGHRRPASERGRAVRPCCAAVDAAVDASLGSATPADALK